jgi:hypothetical protein
MKDPQASPEEHRLFQSYMDWQKRTMGFAFPESELRNDFATNPDGTMGKYGTSGSVREAIAAGMRKPDYSRIQVPVLAFFALPKPLEDQIQTYRPQTAEERAAIEQVYAADVAYARRSIGKLRGGVPGARVVELPGANHYIFLSNEADVLSEIRPFLAGLH